MFENIMWLAIGFAPTYIAMELSYRIAKGRIGKRKAEVVPTISIDQK
ncbi:MAG TPA: hypothetical protein VFY68_10055 [Nitrososphaeraceae archaeon]|jgi:hypothetical protein|nr:hypothetical protein [Nitrososphaeraceae archaeon]